MGFRVDDKEECVLKIEPITCHQSQNFYGRHTILQICGEHVQKLRIVLVGILSIGYLFVEIKRGEAGEIRHVGANVMLAQIVGIDKPHAVVNRHSQGLFFENLFQFFVLAIEWLERDDIGAAYAYAHVVDHSVGLIV